jgi:hypothetical protein
MCLPAKLHHKSDVTNYTVYLWGFLTGYCTGETAHRDTGAPILPGRWPSLSAHESESMLRTYLVCRVRQANGKWEKHSVLITAILLPQRLSCYWGKIVSLRMLTDFASDHCAIENHRTRSALRPMHFCAWRAITEAVLLDSERGGRSSIPGQGMWNLLLIKLYLGPVLARYSNFPCQLHSIRLSYLLIHWII